ncbi:DUF6612 family protein [Virgibacillus soli]|uniref:DUF6612 family protein n=1 Tax=Paracerasibacillus soli TaxID=480284 RepID=UPI0035EB335F
MKKWMLMITLILTIGLVGCGNKAEPVDGTKKEKVSELTAEEVYKKALAAAEKINSAELTMDIKQKINIPSEDIAIDSTTKMDAQMILDPLAMYQNGKISMSMDGESMDMNMELYLSDNAIYTYDSESEKWLKMDGSMLEMMANQQQDPTDQLKILEQFTKDLKFTQTDDAFILELTADGDKVKEISSELMKEYMPQELMEQFNEIGQDMLDALTVKTLTYEMEFDKKTFDLKDLDMAMDMSFEIDGETLDINQEVKATYQSINSIDKIEIPQDVIDSAIEM